MKLSELKQGDDFCFDGKQKATCLKKGRRGSWIPSYLDADERTQFEVLKKNEKSVKCRVIFTDRVYDFIFGEWFYNEHDVSKDCEVKLIDVKSLI